MSKSVRDAIAKREAARHPAPVVVEKAKKAKAEPVPVVDELLETPEPDEPEE